MGPDFHTRTRVVSPQLDGRLTPRREGNIPHMSRNTTIITSVAVAVVMVAVAVAVVVAAVVVSGIDI